MNYLAHLYLSGNDKETIVGNFIGDYVKGKSYTKYPLKIQKGILMHRQIDSFTDNHPKFREAKKLLNDEYGLYSGIIIDFFYDHFLARNWDIYSKRTLRDFAKKTRAVLLSHFFHLPVKVQRFLPFLIQNRRLESYANIDGIQQSLEIMSRYTSLPEKSQIAIEILKLNFEFLHENFSVFMLELIEFVEGGFEIEINRPNVITGSQY